MNHDQRIEPMREQHDTEEQTPQGYGFPDKPTVAESRRWVLQESFLKEFAKTHRLCESADAVGITPQAVEQWRHGATTNGRDLNAFNFTKRLDLASLRYQEVLDAEIDRRAVEGIDKPIYYKGEKVDTVKEYSDNLLRLLTTSVVADWWIPTASASSDGIAPAPSRTACPARVTGPRCMVTQWC